MKRSITVQEMLSFLKSKQIDHTADYQRAGRRYRALTDDQLRDQWKAVMRAMAADVTNAKLRSEHTDLSCEFALRGTEEPFQDVQGEIDAYMERTIRLMETVTSDPKRIAEIDADLRPEIEKYRSAKKLSN